jgi:DNA-binding CsgD family transcriptional regulator/PAS domain-containing protein
MAQDQDLQHRKLQRLYADYQRALGAQRFREQDLDYSRLDYHLPLLERLDTVDDSSVVLYDLCRRRYVFLTGSFKFLLGVQREQALNEGPEYFYREMHPEDLPVVLDTVTRTLRFLYNLPLGERKNYRLSFDFRIRRADGRLVRLLQQIVVLELDRRGNIWLILAVNDLVHDGSLETPAARSLRHLQNGKYYLFAPTEEAAGSMQLSPREIEVLGLVAVGMVSREIADRLCISVATVNNHRQHILEKTGAKNSAEAVRYAAELGIL